MDRSREDIPGEAGVWVFVLGDMLVFGLFFCVYVYYRAFDIEGFREAQFVLNTNLGALNTLVLLLSSWLVVIAMGVAREGQGEEARRFLIGALACGIFFSLIKSFEYTEVALAGIGITTHEFYTYYFIFTGIHLVHVLIGMGVLLFMLGLVRGELSSERLQMMESGCVYWHMVDLLWIILFPLVYLMR